MRLATLDTNSGKRIAAEAADGKYVDLTAADPNLPNCMQGLLSRDGWQSLAQAALKKGEQAGMFVTGKLCAPIPRPGKVICIGLNYRDHAAEGGHDIPTEPVMFGKFSHAVVGPEAKVILPKVAHKVDYEAELVVVIGKEGKNIPESRGFEHVAGYMNGNDVSARDWQIGRPGGQWMIGKTPDTFAPTGPVLVTADEVPDPQKLNIQLRLNGQVMQNSNTRELIFSVPKLIAHLSQLFTLSPGDIIFTGTPPGVGGARKPPVFIKPGDVMEVEIEGLGVLRSPVVAEG